MAEHRETSESETEAAPAQASPAAAAIALGRTSKTNKALDEDARSFLREQTELLRLQKEHLHEQRALVLSRLGLGRLKDRISLALQAMGALAGLAVVVVIAAMAWQAHQDRGLVIDAFSVPPDLARDGLTGQVVAARFLDKLQAMQTATVSDRPANTFTNNWGDEIKLEIPETGLTFGEFDRLLRDKLGHASHVTGEVFKTPGGLAVTARLGEDPPGVFQGPEADLDRLEQQAAETVFRNSQPYRFSAYLEQHGRVDEAFQVISDLAVNGPPSERGWAYAQWSKFDLNDHGDIAAARAHARRALAIGGDSALQAKIWLVGAEVWAGHEPRTLDISRQLARQSQKRFAQQDEAYFLQNRRVAPGWLAILVGDNALAAHNFELASRVQDAIGLGVQPVAMAATYYELDHDPQSARAVMAPLGAIDDTAFLPANALNAFQAAPAYWAAAERQDWGAALAEARKLDDWLAVHEGERKLFGVMRPVWTIPLEALAQARAGDTAGAEALIETTPADCYLCLRVRGQVAAAHGDWSAADHWFAEAARQGPELPFADSDWGEALLAKGDPDGAIAKFKQAHAKGPHFADPLELWGEALMKKGDFAGAVAKFRRADKYAPRWGRNHLLWAEALARMDRPDDARTQFAAAAAQSLSAADRAELQSRLRAL